MRKLLSFFLTACLTAAPVVMAEESPQSYKIQADAMVQTAMELQQQALSMLQSKEMSMEKLSTIVDLYIRAGQKFEQAGKMYQSLGPNYASQQDVANSFGAMQACLDMIERIKKQVSAGPAA